MASQSAVEIANASAEAAIGLGLGLGVPVGGGAEGGQQGGDSGAGVTKSDLVKKRNRPLIEHYQQLELGLMHQVLKRQWQQPRLDKYRFVRGGSTRNIGPETEVVGGGAPAGAGAAAPAPPYAFRPRNKYHGREGRGQRPTGDQDQDNNHYAGRAGSGTAGVHVLRGRYKLVRRINFSETTTTETTQKPG